MFCFCFPLMRWSRLGVRSWSGFGRSLLIFCGVFLPLTLTAWPWEAKWREVTAAELAQTASLIDPYASAEYFISEMEVNDSDLALTRYSQYLRLKVFDERGVEELQVIDIEADWDHRIGRVGARVIRPDGSVEVLPREAFYDREVTRQGRSRRRAKSFSVPGLTPGTIIEYQYEVTLRGGSAANEVWIFNERYPVQATNFRIKGYNQSHRFVYSRVGDGILERSTGGYQELTLRDVPALPREPFRPPYLNTVSWIVMVYASNASGRQIVEDYWKNLGAEIDVGLARKYVKPRQRAVRERVAQLIEGVESEEEILRRIYAFCTTEIINLTGRATGFSAAELEKLKDNEDPSDTLARGYGWPSDINYLFASLAEAAGFEVKVGLANNRALTLFSRSMVQSYGLPDLVIAVRAKESDDWRFFSPGERFLPFGQLSWENASVPVLFANRRREEFVESPPTLAEDNLVERSGDFTLREDGTLIGTLELTYHGQWAMFVRRRFEGMEGETLVDALGRDLWRALPQAVVNAATIEDPTDSFQPVTVRLDFEVPGYAEGTANRLFLTLNALDSSNAPAAGSEQRANRMPYNYGVIEDILVRAPRFTAEERKFPVYFPYSFEVRDVMRINLPADFELDYAEAPASVVEMKAFRHEVSVGYMEPLNRLIYRRKLSISTNLIPQEQYLGVKLIFDALHEQDKHLVMLKRVEATPESVSAAAPVARAGE